MHTFPSFILPAVRLQVHTPVSEVKEYESMGHSAAKLSTYSVSCRAKQGKLDQPPASITFTVFNVEQFQLHKSHSGWNYVAKYLLSASTKMVSRASKAAFGSQITSGFCWLLRVSSVFRQDELLNQVSAHWIPADLQFNTTNRTSDGIRQMATEERPGRSDRSVWHSWNDMGISEIPTS